MAQRRNPSGIARYLYERLEEKEFQRLCAALLKLEQPGVNCYPVGQKDGGRDIVHGDSDARVIFQVKWTKNSVKNPVVWLTAAVAGERKNIERLVKEGAVRYVLMTNMEGTSQAGRGTIDGLNRSLEKFSEEFGIPFECRWSTDLDAAIDSAPDELKWRFAEMLAGWDLIRYLMSERVELAQHQALRKTLLKVMATQWVEDSRIKFKQADLEAASVSDLFVDVEADEISAAKATPATAASLLPTITAEVTRDVGGAASFLLGKRAPQLTVVRGAPGQGKSTLGQLLCQAHRSGFLDPAQMPVGRPDQKPAEPRVALRIDLQDYAAWLSGRDPFSADEATASHPLGESVEAFLVHFVGVKSGATVAPGVVQDVLDRFPLFIVFDGLDEVAKSSVRSKVVREVEVFAARATSGHVPIQIVVTTRPSNGQLSEPWANGASVLVLRRLSEQLRTEYLRKWADLRKIRGRERRDLERVFRSRSAEPHILQLSENPMQLSILLYLIQKRGESIPRERTELYRSYMETFLDREAEKSLSVATHREDLEEVTAFLGWHIQTLAESDNGNGQLGIREIKAAIVKHLWEVGKPTELVEDLFTAITDRVWVLTSKESGTFQFDVQPVREYFAALFLHDYAGAGSSRFDQAVVLRQLVRRPYWLNTARFYAGFASVNELTGMVETLEEELESLLHAGQTRIAAWAFLTDGIFQPRPRSQERALALFLDDLGVRLLPRLRQEGDLPSLSEANGSEAYLAALQSSIEANVRHPLAIERMSLCAEIAGRNLWTWCEQKLEAAAGTSEEDAWLRVLTVNGGAARSRSDVTEDLDLSNPGSSQLCLNAGVSPIAGGKTETRLYRDVLRGLCSETSRSNSRPADLAVMMAPQRFLRLASVNNQAYQQRVGFYTSGLSQSQRRTIGKRLVKLDRRYEGIIGASSFRRGEAGTTAPWVNSARAVAAIHGPNFLSAEVATIGAAADPSRLRTGGGLTRNSKPLGENADYGRLVELTRTNRGESDWWQSCLHEYGDPVSTATLVLGLLGVADAPVLEVLLPQIDEFMRDGDPELTQAVSLASGRLGASGIARRVDLGTFSSALTDMCLPAAQLLFHHVSGQLNEWRRLEDTFLIQAAGGGLVGWPSQVELSRRFWEAPDEGTLASLIAVGSPETASPDGPIRTVGNLSHGLIAMGLAEPARLPYLVVRHLAMNFPHNGRSMIQIADSEKWFE